MGESERELNRVAPVMGGWAGAAMTIRGVRMMTRRVLVSITPSGHGSILIDPRDDVYVWQNSPQQFPVAPEEVLVSTHPAPLEGPPLAGTARDVDLLLWMIGLHAFPQGRAAWLHPGDKYRLKRWPDLSELPHTPVQARIVNTLAKRVMTVEKLCALAKVEREEAQPVVNALSLMSALRRINSDYAAPILPPRSAEVPVTAGD